MDENIHDNLLIAGLKILSYQETSLFNKIRKELKTEIRVKGAYHG